MCFVGAVGFFFSFWVIGKMGEDRKGRRDDFEVQEQGGGQPVSCRVKAQRV